MDISNTQLRQFLNEYFDGDELDDLCFDYFPRVQQRFRSDMDKTRQIRLLLSHCRNHGERDRLIGALQVLRPGPFQQEFELTQPEPAPTRTKSTPSSRNPRQIFISHAYEDAKLAHSLAADLQQRGWQVWIAPDSIQPGEKWVAAINRGLAESGVFALLVSQHAVQSRWVNREADIAIQWEHESKMRFIPVQTTSRSLSHVPPLWYGYQDISFAGDYEDGLNPLLAKLEKQPYYPPPPKPSVWQRLLDTFKQIPNIVWGDAGSLVAAVVLIAWLSLLAGDADNGATRELAATPATAEVAAASMSTNTPTRQLTRTPTTAATTTPTETPQPKATATPTTRPSSTSRPVTPTHTATATPDPNIPPANASLHDTWTRPTNGMTMVYVPGGTFMMGSALDDWNAESDERPPHEVTLDSFWLDQHEVTNAQFAAFLNGEGNQQEGGVTWLESDSNNVLVETTGGTFRPSTGFADHPVIMVSWYGANAYCQWAGVRLPTEAQWEYTARGRGGIYPWGDELPDATFLNYANNIGSTTAVGSYSPQGDSWVGAQDMAGNVWEWVADWYDSYSNASQNNPTGPADGTYKVLRGGSRNYGSNFVRSANRQYYSPDFPLGDVGFRCAVSPVNTASMLPTTLAPTATSTPTSTSTRTPTNTPIPNPIPTATFISAPPTDIPTPPTDTPASIPPTDTPAPIPPTDTPAPIP